MAGGVRWERRSPRWDNAPVSQQAAVRLLRICSLFHFLMRETSGFTLMSDNGYIRVNPRLMKLGLSHAVSRGRRFTGIFKE